MESEQEQPKPVDAPTLSAEQELPSRPQLQARSLRAKSILWELGKIFVIALLIVLPVRLFIMQPFFVRGSSMEPTYLDGDYLIVDEISFRLNEPQRGDVIIFRYPLDPSQFFIKRIVGLPNETISVESNGRIVVHSDEYPEGAVFDQFSGHGGGFGGGPVSLGVDQYYVLGDNREASSDSRRWGSLPRDHIIGRAWLRLWPADRIDLLTN